jgi:DNA polymerase I-like protein with 3'-5' exonuclease and polymerase domains
MEFGIAAAKSGDLKMQAAYKSGDCYLAFAKQAGAVPPDATKETHSSIRDQYKTCVLGVQYGISTTSLATRLGGQQYLARELLRAHKTTYHVFWRWIDCVVSEAMFTNVIKTEFGWKQHIVQGQNIRSLMNFPMQATGAEIMRVAAILMTERGIPVGGVVHDAFAICCPLDQLEAVKAAAEAAMREASRIVLGGFELDVEIKEESIVRWPNRYMDERGKDMWNKIMMLLDRQIKKRKIA